MQGAGAIRGKVGGEGGGHSELSEAGGEGGGTLQSVHYKDSHRDETRSRMCSHRPKHETIDPDCCNGGGVRHGHTRQGVTEYMWGKVLAFDVDVGDGDGDGGGRGGGRREEGRGERGNTI
jgi:hypothetical protein